MFSFLRRIRMSLLDSGSAKKYFLYAIGEIALVVIGILIAIQINNWNEWRRDRVKEQYVLKELQETVQANNQLIENALGRFKDQNVSSQIILDFLNDSIPYSDTLSIHFQQAAFPGTQAGMGLSDAGYQSLENVGYDIMRNDSLKKMVIAYFENDIPRLYATFTINREAKLANYDEYVQRNFRNMKGSHSLPLDVNKIKEDNYYHSIIMTILDNRSIYLRRSHQFLQKGRNVLTLIQNELNQDN